jgi:5-hydroxyisourate hydrolase
MTRLTTHVLDIARGVPAAGLTLRLYALDGETRRLVSEQQTNGDGRTAEPIGIDLASGTYEIVFAVGPYFAEGATPTLYDEIPVRFTLDAEREHHHIPLLLSPFGYSTYRGS